MKNLIEVGEEFIRRSKKNVEKHNKMLEKQADKAAQEGKFSLAAINYEACGQTDKAIEACERRIHELKERNGIPVGYILDAQQDLIRLLERKIQACS